MGFINLERLNIRKRNSCASTLLSLSDVQPPSVYKSHILNGPINKLYILQKRFPATLISSIIRFFFYCRQLTFCSIFICLFETDIASEGCNKYLRFNHKINRWKD